MADTCLEKRGNNLHRKPVLAMGYFTGMRQGEILPLRWEQVSFRDSQVLLDPGTTKNDEPQIVPLTGELLAILEMQFSDTKWTARNARMSSFTGEERSERSERHGGTHASVWALPALFASTAESQVSEPRGVLHVRS
jgi:integrase